MIANFHYDVVIIGGGPVGATLALALRDAQASVLVLEARDPAQKRADGRVLALSEGSRQILDRLEIWSQLPDVTPIAQIHVSQRGGFGRVVLDAADLGFSALGHVVPHDDIAHALHQRLSQAGTPYLTGARVHGVSATERYVEIAYSYEGLERDVTAQLVVLADGGKSVAPDAEAFHTRDYDQYAMVSRVTTEIPHDGRAFERFTPDGPVALLPFGDHYALIWTVPKAQVEEVAAWDDATFLARLSSAFGDRCGRFLSVGPRGRFPLALTYARPVVGRRQVRIGNAAQALHPVAGQGFNLGLRDAWELARLIKAAGPHALGEHAWLNGYAQRRRVDRVGGIVFTDALVRGFSNHYPGWTSARGAGLFAFDAVPPLRRFLMRRMIFGARGG